MLNKLLVFVFVVTTSWSYDVTYSDVMGKQISDAENCTTNFYSDMTFDEFCTGDTYPAHGTWFIQNGYLIENYVWKSAQGYISTDSTNLKFSAPPAAGVGYTFYSTEDQNGDGKPDIFNIDITSVSNVTTDYQPQAYTLTYSDLAGKTLNFAGGFAMQFNADMTYKETVPDQPTDSILGTWSIQNGVILRNISFTDLNTSEVYNEVAAISMSSAPAAGVQITLALDENNDNVIDRTVDTIASVSATTVTSPSFPANYEAIADKQVTFTYTNLYGFEEICVSEFYKEMNGRINCNTNDELAHPTTSAFYVWHVENGYVLFNMVTPQIAPAGFFTTSNEGTTAFEVGGTIRSKQSLDQNLDGNHDVYNNTIVDIKSLSGGTSPAVIMYLLN